MKAHGITIPDAEVTGGKDAIVTTGDDGFGVELAKRKQGPAKRPVVAKLAGPANLSQDQIAAGSSSATMPSDDDATFLVVDEVTAAVTHEGEDVAVVTGEAVEDADTAIAVAAERGSSVVLELSDGDYLHRTVPGSLFASILIDQRSGVLPNPYSLMRLPDITATAAEKGAIDPECVGSCDDAELAPAGVDSHALGKELGREMSRLETAVWRLSSQVDRALAALRARIGL